MLMLEEITTRRLGTMSSYFASLLSIGALKRSFREAIADALAASRPEVHFEMFHFVPFTFHEPAAFFCRIANRGVYPLRRGWIDTFQNERIVSHGACLGF
jgi:hypothetical protein